MLTDQSLKSGSGCPDPERPPSKERGVMHEGKRFELENGDRGLREVEGTSYDNTCDHLMCTIVT